METITVTFTKIEADAVIVQLVGLADKFDTLIAEQARVNPSNTDRIIELAVAKKSIQDSILKLSNAGASIM